MVNSINAHYKDTNRKCLIFTEMVNKRKILRDVGNNRNRSNKVHI